MSLDPTQMRLLNAIMDRAARDLPFRRQLMTTPAPAIRDAFGVQIPADFRIKFVERGPDVDSLVVLPDYRSGGEEELSEEELEAVAGGTDTTVAWSQPTPPPPPPPAPAP
jgi:hypothetical protein